MPSSIRCIYLSTSSWVVSHKNSLPCGPAISSFYLLRIFKILSSDTFAWGRVQIVGGARCSLGPPVLELQSLSTSVEVCRLKRENVSQRCNIGFTLAIVSHSLHAKLFSESEFFPAGLCGFRRLAETCALLIRRRMQPRKKKKRSWCLSVKVLEKCLSVFRACFVVASWPQAVKLAAVYLSGSLVLAFASLPQSWQRMFWQRFSHRPTTLHFSN